MSQWEGAAQVAATDSDPPRLANDTFRAWIATALGVAVSFVAAGGYIGYLKISDAAYEQLLATTLNGLVGVTAIFVLYELFTWRTFRRAGADELACWLAATTPRRRRSKIAWAMSGGGATSWSAQAAVFALLA